MSAADEVMLATADDAVDIEKLLDKQTDQSNRKQQEDPTPLKTQEKIIMADAPQQIEETLLDTDTQEESSSAFATLTSAVKQKTKLEESGPPIGDLVQEALKPMLKEWLDKNLKGIVERAVTKEVKRISSNK